MSEAADRVFREARKQMSTDDLREELASRGEIVEIATRGGPNEWTYSGAINRCLSCRFFSIRSSYKSGKGECRVRAPSSAGFPVVGAGEWCGEWKERLATQPSFHEPPIETVSNHTVVPHILVVFDAIEKLFANRLTKHTNRYGGKGDLAEDAEHVLYIIKMARNCGLYEDAYERLKEALGEPMPFEVSALLSKVAGHRVGDD